MNASKNGRLYSAMAAVCFSLCALCEMKSFVSYGSYASTGMIWYVSMLVIMNILMAVILFVGKKNIGFLIIIGVEILFRLFLILTIDVASFKFNTIILETIATVGLFVLFLYHVVPSNPHCPGADRILGFVPGVLYIVACLYERCACYDDISSFSDDGFFKYLLTFGADENLSDITRCIGILMLCVWLKKISVATPVANRVAPYPVLDHAVISSRPSSTVDEADVLLKYKALLEAGEITPSQFEAKKKQILKL